MKFKPHSVVSIGVAASLLLGGQALHAADTDGLFAIRGVGGARCEAFLSDIDGESDEARSEAVGLLTTWLSGYLTHANRVYDETYDVVPLASDQDVLAVVAESCRQAPESTVAEVAHSVMAILSGLRVTEQSDVVSIEPGTLVREPVVFAIQQRLVDLGHLEGVPDGAFGRNSMAALEQFKAEAGLGDEGEGLTLNTFLRLFAEGDE